MQRLKELFNPIFLRRRLFLFLAVFGPATITAVSDNDAAGVATYSLAGANFGYNILFVLIFVTILLGITQEMGARISIVTGKGLGDIIRERFGVRVAIAAFGLLLIANVGTILADFSALKVTSIMFHVPLMPLVVAVVIFSFIFVIKGNYQANQKIFLIGIILYFSYVISAIKVHPSAHDVLQGAFFPTGISDFKAYIITSIAVLGTTITPWGQFFISSYITDKKISTDRLKYTQIETYFGALVTDFFSAMMIIATAATLYVHHIPLKSGEQAALAIAPFAGQFASLLFGVGFLTAALMGIIIIALSTSYAFSEFFGVVGSLDSTFYRGRAFYGIFMFQLILVSLLVLIPNISLFTIVLFTQSLNAILLPFLIFFLLKVANDKGLMGAHTNSKWYNYFAVISSILIIFASIFVLFSTFIK